MLFNFLMKRLINFMVLNVGDKYFIYILNKIFVIVMKFKLFKFLVYLGRMN